MNSKEGKNTILYLFEVSLTSLDLIIKLEYSHIAVSKVAREIGSDLHALVKVL